MRYKILEIDPLLEKYESDIELRMNNFKIKKRMLLQRGQKLIDFANGHHYFGLHRGNNGWYYREWAPGAEAMYLTGDFNSWQRHSHPMKNVGNGTWEIFVPGVDSIKNGQRIMAIVVHDGEELDRIPLYANYVVQDPKTIEWNAVVHAPEQPFNWTDDGFHPEKRLFIYECHIGMAQEEARIGTYSEFERNILPRIKNDGYNAIQIMAIMEHPYYASFGYQVTNFFAPSSRFGTPEELKSLINTAHQMGLTVLLDVVHSHAAKNSREGLNMFDGTVEQFFHKGPRGDHSAWNTKLFNYAKPEVLHFLLSNLKYWQEEFHFDGFRFDGVTSMLYHDHGLGSAFGEYDKYFSLNTDTDSVTYLQLANELIRQVNPHAVTIAEDTSAMPGLCLPISYGGMGFDYRLAMGTPDMWIRTLRDISDDHWDMWDIWLELSGRRPKEPVIGYVESHDQALVGDKTLMFRLCDKEMYWNMDRACPSLVIERGMALHKMIRLITLSIGGEGYLNFMGNEFGHPEWIDFPREGNDWSYQHCRRQWSLAENGYLRYSYLNNFDNAMIEMAKKRKLLTGKAKQLFISNQEKTLVYERNGLVFAFNFHPTRSYTEYFVTTPTTGNYKVALSTDSKDFGGQERISETRTYYASRKADGRIGFNVYLPSRCAMVLRPVGTHH